MIRTSLMGNDDDMLGLRWMMLPSFGSCDVAPILGLITLLHSFYFDAARHEYLRCEEIKCFSQEIGVLLAAWASMWENSEDKVSRYISADSSGPRLDPSSHKRLCCTLPLISPCFSVQREHVEETIIFHRQGFSTPGF